MRPTVTQPMAGGSLPFPACWWDDGELFQMDIDDEEAQPGLEEKGPLPEYPTDLPLLQSEPLASQLLPVPCTSVACFDAQLASLPRGQSPPPWLAWPCPGASTLTAADIISGAPAAAAATKTPFPLLPAAMGTPSSSCGDSDISCATTLGAEAPTAALLACNSSPPRTPSSSGARAQQMPTAPFQAAVRHLIAAATLPIPLPSVPDAVRQSVRSHAASAVPAARLPKRQPTSKKRRCALRYTPNERVSAAVQRNRQIQRDYLQRKKVRARACSGSLLPAHLQGFRCLTLRDLLR